MECLSLGVSPGFNKSWMESIFWCLDIFRANKGVDDAEGANFLLFDIIAPGIIQQSQDAQILAMTLCGRSKLHKSNSGPLYIEIGGFADP